MALQANWFAGVAESDDFDPFAESSSGSPVVSIDSTEEELFNRLKRLLRRESNLFEMGITCPLKDQPNATCSACPVCKLGDPESRLSALCRVGQEQERVETMILAKRHGV